MGSGTAEKDPFHEYEYQEIMVEVLGLDVNFASFDEDNIMHRNSTEILATLGSLGLSYVERFQSKRQLQGEYDQKQYKILWKKDTAANLICLRMDIANQKMKSLQPELLEHFID